MMVQLHSDGNYHTLVTEGGVICFSYETPVGLLYKGTLYGRKKYSKASAISNSTRRHLRDFGIYNLLDEFILGEEAFELKLRSILLAAAQVNDEVPNG